MELPGSPVHGHVASPFHSVFLNGVVHYHLELENPERQVIVAFDVHKEEVKFMAFPPAIHPKGLCVFSKLGGRLAIFEHPNNRSRDSFNVHMQLINPGGGGGGEWNVEHRITRDLVDCCFGVSDYVHLYPPATCDYQVIIKWGDQVIAYDIRTRKMRMLPMASMFCFTTGNLLHNLQLTLVTPNGFIES